VLRHALVLCLGGALAIGGVPAAQAQTTVTDVDVQKGIRLVDDGDYDAAIVVLDTAARRLSGDASKVRELSQAYLYLGIAYVGKGHEAAAKAKFREAVAGIKDLTLSAEKYPPKVINLFEAARDEARAGAAPPATVPSSTITNVPLPAKTGGGGKKVLLIVGGLAVAGGGAAVALGGGGSSTGDSSSGGSGQTLERSEVIGPQEQKIFNVTPSRAGTLQVQVTWRNRDLRIDVGCQEHAPPYVQCGGNYVRTSDTTATFNVSVQQKEYDVILSNFSSVATPEPCTVVVRYP
jgi:hypothetical protein